MAVSVVHATVATLPDEAGAEINKDEWNEAHTVTGLGTMAEKTDTDYLAKADNLSGLTDAAAARTNLGLGTMAEQAADAVDIDGGAIDGTVIGGATPAAGSFTTINGSGTAILNAIRINATSQDNWIQRAQANSLVFSGGASNATSRTQMNKLVSSITDNVATATFTVTVPNAAHCGVLKVALLGSLGSGGAVGANEATASISYDIAITRTAGANATAAISSAYGSVATAVSGAATVTVAGTLSAISGAAGATNTFTVNVTITRSGGSSTNHTCLCYGRLMNQTFSGITIA